MLLLFVSCSFIKEGTIVDKDFVPAHTTNRTTYNQVGKVTVPQTRTVHVPDRYTIKITKVVEGKDKYRRFRVSKSTYDQYDIGEWISFKKD